DRGDVNETVQRLPALAAQPADPARGRGERQRDEENKPQEANGDELALGDVGKHLVHVEKFVQPDIGQEMQAPIKKCEQPQHAPKSYEGRNFEDFPEWGNCQRDEQEAQCPVTGSMRDLLYRICAQPSSPRRYIEGSPPKESPQQQGEGDKTGQKKENFKETNHLLTCAAREPPQYCLIVLPQVHAGVQARNLIVAVEHQSRPFQKLS